MKESELQKQIINLIESRGGYSINVMSASKDGVHDVISCYKGRFLSIEVKVKNNQPSELQLDNGLAVINAGGVSACVWVLGDVEDILDVLDTDFNLINTPKYLNHFHDLFKQTPKLPRL